MPVIHMCQQGKSYFSSLGVWHTHRPVPSTNATLRIKCAAQGGAARERVSRHVARAKSVRHASWVPGGWCRCGRRVLGRWVLSQDGTSKRTSTQTPAGLSEALRNAGTSEKGPPQRNVLQRLSERHEEISKECQQIDALSFEASKRRQRLGVCSLSACAASRRVQPLGVCSVSACAASRRASREQLEHVPAPAATLPLWMPLQSKATSSSQTILHEYLREEVEHAARTGLGVGGHSSEKCAMILVKGYGEFVRSQLGEELGVWTALICFCPRMERHCWGLNGAMLGQRHAGAEWRARLATAHAGGWAEWRACLGLRHAGAEWRAAWAAACWGLNGARAWAAACWGLNGARAWAAACWGLNGARAWAAMCQMLLRHVECPSGKSNMTFKKLAKPKWNPLRTFQHDCGQSTDRKPLDNSSSLLLHVPESEPDDDHFLSSPLRPQGVSQFQDPRRNPHVARFTNMYWNNIPLATVDAIGSLNRTPGVGLHATDSSQVVKSQSISTRLIADRTRGRKVGPPALQCIVFLLCTQS
ncbi:hypothetical protein CYMTET_31375 [Cymbomonas tetramitiformis]|uniref:Uncharacterized protein n=1 Tax=Cymbomonas tetramitiformis TaxID=36881 RepID=A0AAE0KT12_9CHLO|nr:hypothetical protein CYMTET_31375 [Cymbomonas tetramitiformis]